MQWNRLLLYSYKELTLAKDRANQVLAFRLVVRLYSAIYSSIPAKNCYVFKNLFVTAPNRKCLFRWNNGKRLLNTVLL